MSRPGYRPLSVLSSVPSVALGSFSTGLTPLNATLQVVPVRRPLVKLGRHRLMTVPVVLPLTSVVTASRSPSPLLAKTLGRP